MRKRPCHGLNDYCGSFDFFGLEKYCKLDKRILSGVEAATGCVLWHPHDKKEFKKGAVDESALPAYLRRKAE